MKDKWLDELRKGMSDFEMDAPEGLWESLGVEKPVSSKSVWRRRWIVAAAAIAILIIGSGTLVWMIRTEPVNVDAIRLAATPGQIKQPEVGILTNHKQLPASGGNLRAKTSEKSIIHENQKAIKDITDTFASDENNALSLLDTVKTANMPDGDQSKSSAVGSKSNPEHKQVGHESYFTGRTNSGKRLNNTKRLALKVSASGIGSSAEGSIYRTPSLNGNLLAGNDPELWFGTNGVETTKIRHHQPVRMAMTLQYNITERIGIETGLVYSRIGSDIAVSLENRTSTGIRRMQYVGIPLNVKFSAWSWKFIDLYLSAGPTVEKCVSNRFETKSTAEGLSLEEFSGQREKPIQWSVNAAAGIQLRPMPNIGIFAEPGVSYYFNDGTSIETIYKDKPCNFNLNVGLRFTFNP